MYVCVFGHPLKNDLMMSVATFFYSLLFDLSPEDVCSTYLSGKKKVREAFSG